MIIDKIKEQRDNINSFVCIVLCMLSVYFVVWSFTGMWPWIPNPYNSYALQAARWAKGHLDLGMDYPYLELAIHNGKYFVSFPPFPSYVLFPFALILGTNTPDSFICLATSIIGALYVFKVLRHFNLSHKSSIFWTVFVMLGTNMVFITINSWVWFMAQNMCFALSVMAIYYALNAKGGLSLAFWACSVGCRPFNILYVPILLYILYRKIKEKDGDITLLEMILKNLKWVIAPCIIAASYMILNYLRFGSIFEFGHNFLPEFVRAENGQFHFSYIVENFSSLFQFPSFAEGRTLRFNGQDRIAFYIVSPIYISYIIYLIRALIRRMEVDKILLVLIPCTVIVHFICLIAHRTTGGFHFGHRYLLDALPFVLLALASVVDANKELEKYQYPLAMLGIALNIIGTIAVYNYWI